ncbi:MAG: hypothetical protein EOP51_10900 [Sphingobacteriales bacterium]|nr:MAG: hypothetical protein EOP51_10900 [Sphingobacteriales bacterium]
MKLPTALRGNVDYHVFSNLYVNADFIINVSKGGSTYTNTISLMPAYRTKWFSVGVPMTSNKLGGSSFGAYLQAGPLQLGSSTLLSNMAKEKIGNADLYAALSFNF